MKTQHEVRNVVVWLYWGWFMLLRRFYRIT